MMADAEGWNGSFRRERSFEGVMAPFVGDGSAGEGGGV